ncbi:hypothetical protein P0F32_003374 [Vibrio metschnikovii]|nr:hypothetical protein [Vibrio metschnikovii]
MEPVNISSYNDDPPPFLLWSSDEVALIPLGLVISIFTGNALVLCLLGLVTTYDPDKWSMSMKPGYQRLFGSHRGKRVSHLNFKSKCDSINTNLKYSEKRRQ